METNDYVSYPLAKALKSAGFDEPCDHYYTPEIYSEKYIEYPMLLWEKTAINSNDIIYEGERFSAPTLWQAQKWLREKGIAVSVQASEIQGELWYSADIITTKGINELVDGGFDYMGYKSALSAGIEAALKLLDN